MPLRLLIEMVAYLGPRFVVKGSNGRYRIEMQKRNPKGVWVTDIIIDEKQRFSSAAVVCTEAAAAFFRKMQDD